MRADPFDLSTWRDLDYRRRATEARPMTKEELAAAFVAARIRFIKARENAQEAKMLREMREAGAMRLNAELDVLVARQMSQGGDISQACADGALKMAEAAALWRAAEKGAQDAEDRLTASTKEADRAFETLIAEVAPPAP